MRFLIFCFVGFLAFLPFNGKAIEPAKKCPGDSTYTTYMLQSYYDAKENDKIIQTPLDQVDLENPQNLFILAEAYMGKGARNKEYQKKAKEYYARAAELGHAASWARLGTELAYGTFYIKSDTSSIPENVEKANSYFKKACDSGYRWACCYDAKDRSIKLCSPSSFKTKGEWAHYLFGQDFKEAWEFLQNNQDCNDPEVLFYLGLFYEKGIETGKDLKKAEFYYQKSFDKGFARAAYRLAILYRKKNTVNSQYYAEQACKMGNKNGCKGRYANQFLDWSVD